MAWPKWPEGAEPDPVKRRARELEQQERNVAAQLGRLKEEIDALRNPPPPPPVETVWRAPKSSDAERVRQNSGRQPERTHAAQRRRDRTRFILLALGLLLVLLWLIHLL